VQTAIPIALAEAGKVEVEVYDVRGRSVRRLIAGDFPVGSHVIAWDGLDQSGHEVASGTYFYRLRVNDRVVNQEGQVVHKAVHVK
jgi:flagellar hook assembly protein FlgD